MIGKLCRGVLYAILGGLVLLIVGAVIVGPFVGHWEPVIGVGVGLMLLGLLAGSMRH